MANEKNLVPLTTKKAREIGKKGGVKSGQVRREKKLLSQIYAEVIAKNAKTIQEAIEMKLQNGDISFLPEMGKLTEGSKVNVGGIAGEDFKITFNPVKPENAEDKK